MARFINPFTDVGFKRVFGQEISKPLLLDFLNCLLVGERRIEDIRFLDKEQVGSYDGDRSLIYDVFCTTDTGEEIIVEMQNRNQPQFKQRTIYYASEAIARQGERGAEWRYDVKSVYLVSFLNFKSDNIGRQFRTDVALMDMQSKSLFSDKLRLVYLQLPYFQKEADECENDFERWIYVLKNMETLNRLPWIAQSAVFQKLASIGEVGALSREERMKYDYALKKYRDTLNVMDGAIQEGLERGRTEGRAKGLAEGRAKGLAEGRAEGRAEGMREGAREERRANARKMKEMGLPILTITEVTGLSEQEILSLT